jgi:hypothetical protein
LKSDALNQVFIDCAFYGYTEGFKAVLSSGKTFAPSVWFEALKGAAISGSADVVRFILNQYVLQKLEIVADVDWLRLLDERNSLMAADIDACDRYVRSEKLRVKLESFGIQAPAVSMPDFIDSSAVIYKFVRESDAESVEDSSAADKGSKGAVFAGADQFGRGVKPSGLSRPDAAFVERFLTSAKRAGV